MKPTELILVRFLPLMDYILYCIYEEDGFLGPRPDDGQVQDCKSNAKGISFGED